MTGGRVPTAAAVVTVVAIGVMATVVGVVGVGLGIGTTTATSGISMPLLIGAVLRTVLTLAAVAAGVYLAAMLTGRGTVGGWTLVGTLAVFLDLWAWGGNALLTASLLSGGGGDQGIVVRVVGFVVDLAVWAVVARFAARAGLAAGVRRREGAGRLS